MHRYRITFKPKSVGPYIGTFAYAGCGAETTIQKAPLEIAACYVDFRDRFVQFRDGCSDLISAYDTSEIESVVRIDETAGATPTVVQGDKDTGGCTFKVTVSQ